MILAGNPVYDAPGDLDFREALKKIPTTIHLGEYEDETASECSWHLPKAHAFEAWSDVCGWDGSIHVSQPLIAPLLNGKSELELLGILCDQRREPQEIVRSAVSATQTSPLTDASWDRLLHDGFLAESSTKPVNVASGFERVRRSCLQKIIDRSGNDLEIVFLTDSAVLDGRFANKLVW